jgi:hypothetical protein
MQNSTNTAEGRTDTGKAPDPEPGQLSDVVDLLTKAQDDQDDQGTGDDDGARAPENVDVPKTLDAIAEGLGVQVADLYEIEIPLGSDQESITLGALKDLGKAGSQIDLDRIEFEETKTQFETQQRKTAQDFADLVASLPQGVITNDLVDKIHAQRAAIQEREEKLIAATIPTWSDPVVRSRENKVMAEYLDEFGFPQDFLDTVVDHKTTALIRDAALRKQRLEQALTQVRQVRNTGHGVTTTPSKPRSNRQTKVSKTRRSNSQVSEVADLISSALKG